MTSAFGSKESLEAALGPAAWRAGGISTWEDVANLGGSNLCALRDYAQEFATRALADEDREALAAVRPGLDRLVELARLNHPDKPLLPRLRRENFRRAQPVRIFLGEHLGPHVNWVQGTIVTIEKWYNLEWKGAEPNSGYYWRIGARILDHVPESFTLVHFSTSEPRVLPESDYAWLRAAVNVDPRFLGVFAANAKRSWQPLWYHERATVVDVDAMDMLAWLVD